MDYGLERIKGGIGRKERKGTQPEIHYYLYISFDIIIPCFSDFFFIFTDRLGFLYLRRNNEKSSVFFV